MTVAELEDRIDTLEQLADSETEDYAAFCRIQSELWELRAELAERGLRIEIEQKAD